MSKNEAIEKRFEQAMVEKEVWEKKAKEWKRKAISAQSKVKAHKRWDEETKKKIEQLETFNKKISEDLEVQTRKAKELETERRHLAGDCFKLERKNQKLAGKNSALTSIAKHFYNQLMQLSILAGYINWFNMRRKKRAINEIAQGVFEIYNGELHG